VTPSLSRALDWPADERRAMGFQLLARLGPDSPCPPTWEPMVRLGALELLARAGRGDVGRRSRGGCRTGLRLQSQFMRIARATGFGPMHACLEVIARHRGPVNRMLPAPLRPARRRDGQAHRRHRRSRRGPAGPGRVGGLKGSTIAETHPSRRRRKRGRQAGRVLLESRIAITGQGRRDATKV